MSAILSAIGIDFGSSRTVISVFNSSGIDVLVNQSSYRQNPSLISYSDQRAVGDKATQKIKKELPNTIINPLRFIGEMSETLLKTEQQYNFSQTQIVENGKVYFTVKYQGEYTVVTIEQAIAAIFSEVKSVLRFNNLIAQEVVVSVPSYFSQMEREMLLVSAKIAGLQIAKLLNESMANVLNYSIFRRGEFSVDVPRIVGFVDVGHCKTSVYFANILNSSIDLICELNDHNLGCRNMDLAIAKFYAEMIKKKYKFDVLSEKKTAYRILEAIQKQRTTLTINSEAPINLECLVGDIDFNYTLKRDEFEKINADFFKQFKNLLDKAYRKLSKEQVKAVHSVERVGGGCRMPAIERVISATLKVKAVSKTLDASESCTRGCAIQAAMLSPKFNAVSYQFKERLLYPISVKLQYDKEEPSTKTLFEIDSEFGKRLSINLNKPSLASVGVYVPPHSNFEEKLVAETVIPRRKPGEETIVGFLLNQNGIVGVENAIVRLSVENHVGNQQHVEALSIKVKNPNELPLDDFLNFQKKEEAILAYENIIQETLECKNKLEAIVYDTRNHLNSTKYGQLFLQNDKNLVLDLLGKIEDWLYGEGANLAKLDYLTQTEYLESYLIVLRQKIRKYEDLVELVHENELFLANFETLHGQNWEKFIAEDREVIKSCFDVLNKINSEFRAFFDNINIETFDKMDLLALKNTVEQISNSLKQISIKY